MDERTIWTASLEQNVSEGWFDARSKFALFRYMPAGTNVVKQGMKYGDTVARHELGLWLVGTLPGLRVWLDSNRCGSVIAMPGHKPDKTGAVSANDFMCILIARTLRSIAFMPSALVRTRPVNSYWRDGVHPGPDEHLASIVYRGKKLEARSSVLIFDDQHTTGATFEAASSIVQRATGAKVLGLFLTRSRAPGPPNPVIRRAKRL